MDVPDTCSLLNQDHRPPGTAPATPGSTGAASMEIMWEDFILETQASK